MKKEGVLLLVVFILILSICFASASWFGDFLNKVTGKAIENETNETNTSSPQTCLEKGGYHTYSPCTKGQALEASDGSDCCSEAEDCEINVSIPYGLVCYCEGIGGNVIVGSLEQQTYMIYCCDGIGAHDGPCPSTYCSKTDVNYGEGSWDVFEKGTAANASVSYTDYCDGGGNLVEYYCSEGNIKSNQFSCGSFYPQRHLISPYTCSDGKCLQENPPEDPNQPTTTSSGSGGGGGGGGTVGTTTNTNVSSGGAGNNTSTIGGSSSGGSGVVSITNFSVNSVTTTATGVNGIATVTGPSGTTAVSSVQVSAADGKVYATKEDGSKQEIKVDPIAAINSVNESVKSGTFGEVRIIEYKNNIIYEMEVTKKVKVIALIPANMIISARVDVEEGNIISVKKPWWGFLARDINEEN